MAQLVSSSPTDTPVKWVNVIQDRSTSHRFLLEGDKLFKSYSPKELRATLSFATFSVVAIVSITVYIAPLLIIKDLVLTLLESVPKESSSETFTLSGLIVKGDEKKLDMDERIQDVVNAVWYGKVLLFVVYRSIKNEITPHQAQVLFAQVDKQWEKKNIGIPFAFSPFQSVGLLSKTQKKSVECFDTYEEANRR